MTEKYINGELKQSSQQGKTIKKIHSVVNERLG